MSQHYDFTVIPSDDPDVREVDRGFLTEISWTITAPEGGKSHGVRRVLITADMGATVHLGLLAQPEPVPPYTGGYALAPDLAAEVATRAAADAALDGRVDALEVAPPAHTHPLADVTDAGTAAAADVGDFATAAQGTLADSATQPGDLATVATTGVYADLTGKPTLGTAAATAATDYATAAQGATADGAAQKSANLSDLASASTARTNLGLGDSAVVGALPIPDPGAYYPTDTITAALQLIGGREVYGTGSPEGVVTAAVGTYYTDTAITNGAMRWAKKTGTGNTGWRCVDGDTGWRDIRSLYSANVVEAAAFSLSSRITRVGNTVQYLGRVKPAGAVIGVARANVAGIQGVISTIPAGFNPLPSDNGPKGAVWLAIASQGFLINPSVTSRLDIYMPTSVTGNWAAGDILFLSGSWPTADAWPTTLPGVAA